MHLAAFVTLALCEPPHPAAQAGTTPRVARVEPAAQASRASCGSAARSGPPAAASARDPGCMGAQRDGGSPAGREYTSARGIWHAPCLEPVPRGGPADPPDKEQ